MLVNGLHVEPCEQALAYADLDQQVQQKMEFVEQ